MTKVSAPRTESTTLVDFVLEKSMIFPFLFLSGISMMYPTCDEPSFSPSNEQSEKMSNSDEFLSSFLYFGPSFSCFFKCLMSELITGSYCFWYFLLFVIVCLVPRNFLSCLVCDTNARRWFVVRNS